MCECVCVCVCVGVFGCVWVCVCVGECVRVWERDSMRVCDCDIVMIDKTLITT